MEKEVYIKMKSSKTKNKYNFNFWLEDFLSFSNESKEIIDAFTDWELVMSNPEIYKKKYSRNGSAIFEYSSSKYIYFYDKLCKDPKELTNIQQVALDYKRIVEYFDMNFFNLEEPKIVVLGFIECLDRACKNLNLNIIKIMIRFFRIYFFTQDLDEERKYGPIKTRFVELHKFMAKDDLTKVPDGTIILSKSFYEKINFDQVKIIKDIIEKDTKPTDEDYKQALIILKEYEEMYMKNKEGIFLSEPNFRLIKSKKDKYMYLVNNKTGVVLKAFDIQVPIKNIISMSEDIVR